MLKQVAPGYAGGVGNHVGFAPPRSMLRGSRIKSGFRKDPSEPKQSTAKKTKVSIVTPEYITRFGEVLAVCGSTPELGEWDPTRAVKMTWNPGHKWTTELEMVGGVEFKLVVFLTDSSTPSALDGFRDTKHNLLWEPGPDRVAELPQRDPEDPEQAFMVAWWKHPAETKIIYKGEDEELTAEDLQSAKPMGPPASTMAATAPAVPVPVAPTVLGALGGASDGLATLIEALAIGKAESAGKALWALGEAMARCGDQRVGSSAKAAKAAAAALLAADQSNDAVTMAKAMAQAAAACKYAGEVFADDAAKPLPVQVAADLNAAGGACMVVAGALSKMSDVAAAGSKLAQGSGATAMSYAKAAPSSPQALDSSSSRDSKIIDDLQATIDSLNAKLVATARAASDDKAKITALENEVSKLNDKLAVARGEVAALQKRPAAAASAPAATEAATARSSKTDNYEKLYLAAMKSLQAEQERVQKLQQEIMDELNSKNRAPPPSLRFGRK